jgi:hypothetical protein
MTAIKQTVTVQPGGRVEVTSSELPEGREAEVIILVSDRRSAARPIASFLGAGQGAYETINDADRAIRQGRDGGA